jgi:hypothetical protein
VEPLVTSRLRHPDWKTWAAAAIIRVVMGIMRLAGCPKRVFEEKL